MPPIVDVAVRPGAADHRDAVARHLHPHVAHVAHAGLAHRHVAGQEACGPARRASPARRRSCSGRPWPIWFITWCVMWQCIAQSPGSSATNSMVRVLPTGHEHGRLRPLPGLGDLAAVGLGDLELSSRAGGSGDDPSRRGCRCGCARGRPTLATSGAVPGNALPFIVRTLKSVISFGSGRLVPGSILHSLSMMAKSRSGRGPWGSRGWMTNMPIMPSAICVISS